MHQSRYIDNPAYPSRPKVFEVEDNSESYRNERYTEPQHVNYYQAQTKYQEGREDTEQRAIFQVITNQIPESEQKKITTYVNPDFKTSRYGQLLNKTIDELPEFLNKDEYPKLIKAIGGAVNFISHYGISEKRYSEIVSSQGKYHS